MLPRLGLVLISVGNSVPLTEHPIIFLIKIRWKFDITVFFCTEFWNCIFKVILSLCIFILKEITKTEFTLQKLKIMKFWNCQNFVLRSMFLEVFIFFQIFLFLYVYHALTTHSSLPQYLFLEFFVKFVPICPFY